MRLHALVTKGSVFRDWSEDRFQQVLAMGAVTETEQITEGAASVFLACVPSHQTRKSRHLQKPRSALLPPQPAAHFTSPSHRGERLAFSQPPTWHPVYLPSTAVRKPQPTRDPWTRQEVGCQRRHSYALSQGLSGGIRCVLSVRTCLASSPGP